MQLRRTHAEGTAPAPLIQHQAGACRECWGCVRHCPAKAIRVIDGHAEVIREKCVLCGLCVSECSACGHVVRDDTPLVRELLASGAPVVAVLATEFVAAMHPMSPGEVERSLEGLGFYAVESTLLGEELVAEAYEMHHAADTGVPVIRSTCPVTNEWIRRFHPALTKALVPVAPPYVAQARLVKSVYPEGCAVVYFSPCYARKDEWRDPEFEGAVDAAVTFGEFKRMLSETAVSAPRPGAETGEHRPEPLKEISLTDGFPRATLMSRTMLSSDVHVVRGLKELDRLLSAIEAGEVAPSIVDALNCEGCIDGPAVNPGMSLFAKRNVDAAEREARVHSSVSSRELLRHLPPPSVVRAFSAEMVCVPVPDGREIDRVLAEGGFASRADVIDCAACGYATCVEHAIAICQGNSSWEMCFPVQRERLEESVKRLEDSATLDSLTGLWNRRVFAERLADEMARYVRYEAPFSLLMVDLDGFKLINDQHGHVVGDAVLQSLAAKLRESLRVTDLPSRYGGDEFAVILPGVSKTDAYAVAEKLREAVKDLSLGSDGRPVKVRISVGVAAAGKGMTEAVQLVEAADRALYEAKGNGRDQVRLAPG